MADHYARMEQAIVVLSDLRANTSRIWYGGFSRTLGLASPGEPQEVSSIWEEEIFRLIHPDDLARKHLQELCFFHFITFFLGYYSIFINKNILFVVKIMNL